MSETVTNATKTDVETYIDSRNLAFIDEAKSQLKNLNQYSTEALEWLMMEHYQFSFRNTQFLADAAEVAAGFDTDAVQKELTRNLREENGHAVIYKAALKQVGLDVETRVEFTPTTSFLDTIGELSAAQPSAVLGTMFATETAAIFEHEVFRDVTEEVLKRRNLMDEGKKLIWYHDMHLGGVEQSHKDELGIYLKGLPLNQVVDNEGDRPTIDTRQAVAGAEQAIKAMTQWWADLFGELRAISGISKAVTP